MDSVFIKVDEKELGPVSLDELKTLVREGSFSQNDLVWQEELDEWVPATDAEELDSVFRQKNRLPRRDCKIYAIASGKGGVGKTMMSTSIGVGLAAMGSEVILVDGDFGGANLHTALGLLEPEFTFFDFYTLQKENLNDIVLDTPVDNLRFISGACGTLGLANPKYFQKQRFMRELRKLDTDLVILDLGAGSTYDVIDFFMLADEKIVVVTPEPTSIHEAFGFMKVCLLRELNRQLKEHLQALNILNDERINKPGKTQLTVIDLLRKVQAVDPVAGEKMRNVLDSFSPKLIVNMVKDSDDAKEGLALKAAVLELLGIHVDFLGFVSYDHAVKDAVKNMKPFLLYQPKCQAAQDLSALLRVGLMGKKGLKEILEKRKWRKHIEGVGKQYPTRDLLADAPICSMKCFYWGDCEYQLGGEPCRVRHLEPILVKDQSSE